LIEDLSEHCSVSEEFSGMVKTFVEGIPGNWANKGIQADARDQDVG